MPSAGVSKRLRRQGFRSVSPAPDTFILWQPLPGGWKLANGGGRFRPSPGNDNNFKEWQQLVKYCPVGR